MVSTRRLNPIKIRFVNLMETIEQTKVDIITNLPKLNAICADVFVKYTPSGC
jgi:hypothetical protein